MINTNLQHISHRAKS